MTTAAATSPVNELLTALAGVRSIGQDRWAAQCPAHDDARNSLSVSVGAGGRVLVHCHAGCTYEDVLKSLPPGLLEHIRRAPTSRAPAFGKPVATYDYTNEDGELVFQVQRDAEKNFRQRKPSHLEPPAELWIYSVKDVPKIPYRLHEVARAVLAGTVIFIVEGEKDADTLSQLGLVATTNAGGAGKWTDEHSAHLKDAQWVFIIPDNDEPGIKHARAVRKSIRGLVARVRILKLPDVKSKGDVSDWIADGHTREQLEALCAAPPHLSEEWIGAGTLIQQEAPDVDWLIEDLIARDGIAILSGESSVFKSWTTLHFLLSLATGGTFIERFRCPKSRVMIVNADEPESETRRKLKFLAAGAGMQNGQLEVAEQNLKIRSGDISLTDPDELAALADDVSDYAPDLIVIDSASAVIEGDEMKREFARAARKIVATLREAHPCAIVFIHEWNKPSKEGGKRPGDRLKGTGSLRYIIDHHIALEASVEDVVTFRMDKQRRGRKIAAFDFSVRIIESEGRTEIEYHGDARDRTGQTGCTKAILDWLGAHPGAQPQSDLTRALSADYVEKTVKRGVMTLEGGHEPKVGVDRRNPRRTFVWLLGSVPVQSQIESPSETSGHLDNVGTSTMSDIHKSLPKGDF